MERWVNESNAGDGAVRTRRYGGTELRDCDGDYEKSSGIYKVWVRVRSFTKEYSSIEICRFHQLRLRPIRYSGASPCE
jgi:hypothetical protein